LARREPRLHRARSKPSMCVEILMLKRQCLMYYIGLALMLIYVVYVLCYAENSRDTLTEMKNAISKTRNALNKLVTLWKKGNNTNNVNQLLGRGQEIQEKEE
jgi:hypothetical protein